jgi:carboxyl-terminal processing protease
MGKTTNGPRAPANPEAFWNDCSHNTSIEASDQNVTQRLKMRKPSACSRLAFAVHFLNTHCQRKTGFIRSIAACLCLTLSCLIPACNTLVKSTDQDLALSFPALLREVWLTVKQHYHDPGYSGKDWTQALWSAQTQLALAKNETESYAAIKAMLSTLGDPHTYLLSPQERKARNQEGYAGVGFTTHQHPDQQDLRIVARVTPFSPAETAGIEPGWIFLNPSETDHESFRFLDRHDRIQNIDLSATHIHREWTTRESKHWDRGLFYLRWDRFENGISDWIASEILSNPHCNGLILDLRWNRGGQVDELLKSLSCILPKGTLAGTEKSRIFPTRSLFIPAPPSETLPSSKPLVVLVSESTASSAEIFARVVQCHQRGRIIGNSRTAGAVMISPSWEMPGEALLFVSVKDYLDPSGQRLQNHGVEPDQLVGPQSFFELRRGQDPLLMEATHQIGFLH